MFDWERQKKNFENHIATFTDYGNIKILDFANPNSSHYRIRFLFEEDHYRLHISGDLGELIATNYNNMTYEGFDTFVRDIGYFCQKIDCHSRVLYYFDKEDVKDQLRQIIADNGYDDLLSFDNMYDDVDELIEDMVEHLDEVTGFQEEAFNIWEELGFDIYDLYDVDKKSTGILNLYMLAFKLAKEQLSNQFGEVSEEI